MVKPQVETKSSADVIELVDAARGGDTSAWAELVRRYEPLIASISRRYRISASDAVDVSQTVWLKVVSNLAHLRDPRGLPGWIATTTGRVCMQLIATQRRAVAVDPVVLANPTRPRWAGIAGDPGGREEVDSALQLQECTRAIRDGLAELTPAQRRLLCLLVVDPPLPYVEISRQLGLPIGSIGPTRARCLHKLRRTKAVRRLTAAEPLAPVSAVA